MNAVIIESTKFAGISDYYRGRLIIIDEDDSYLLCEKIPETERTDCGIFAGEKITDLSKKPNLWIDRSGIAYFVPWYSHDFVAEAIFNTTTDDLEKRGWIHLSGHSIHNLNKIKLTDRQYDTFWLWCEKNDVSFSRYDRYFEY